jgi:hypothetical protein
MAITSLPASHETDAPITVSTQQFNDALIEDEIPYGTDSVAQ